MPILLHIDSSPMGAASISRRLTQEFVERWRRANPQAKVLSRDLTTMAIPPVDAEWVAANYTPKELRTQQQNERLALSAELAGELLDADEYVIGVPMHNWGPSSSFKLWVDQIVLFGETMLITPSGLKGTLGSKRATFFVAAGRYYGAGSPDASHNHLVPWLRTFFGGLGITDMRIVFVDGTVALRYGKVDRAAFLAPRIEVIESLFAEALPL